MMSFIATILGILFGIIMLVIAIGFIGILIHALKENEKGSIFVIAPIILFFGYFGTSSITGAIDNNKQVGNLERTIANLEYEINENIEDNLIKAISNSDLEQKYKEQAIDIIKNENVIKKVETYQFKNKEIKVISLNTEWIKEVKLSHHFTSFSEDNIKKGIVENLLKKVNFFNDTQTTNELLIKGKIISNKNLDITNELIEKNTCDQIKYNYSDTNINTCKYGLENKSGINKELMILIK